MDVWVGQKEERKEEIEIKNKEREDGIYIHGKRRRSRKINR